MWTWGLSPIIKEVLQKKFENHEPKLRPTRLRLLTFLCHIPQEVFLNADLLRKHKKSVTFNIFFNVFKTGRQK